MDKLPILNDACTLSGEEFEARLDLLRREFLPHVVKREALSDGHALEFELSMKDRLEALVAFEQRCCSDLHWELREEADRMRLEVRGMAGDLLVG